MGEIRAPGTVVGHKHRRYHQSVLIHPVVRFGTPDGRTVESGSGSNVPPGIGEEVAVIYDPLRPEEAKLPLGSTVRFRPRTLLVAGALALGVVVLFILFFLAMVLLLLL